MADLKSTVAAAIVAATTSAIANPATAAQPADKPIIAQTVIDAVTPIVANATNAEPWYQSHVTWGGIVAVAAPIVGQIIGHQFTPDEQATVITIATSIGAAIGGVIALYGRWVAKKPLGS